MYELDVVILRAALFIITGYLFSVDKLEINNLLNISYLMKILFPQTPPSLIYSYHLQPVAPL